MRNDTVPVENYPLKSIKPAGIRCMGQAAQIGLLGLSLQELTLLVEEAGQPGFRGRQLFEALYRQRVESAEQVSTLPLEFRRALAQSGVSVGLPVIEKRFVSSDGTVRYLMNFVDGQSVETVWMPEGDGGESGDGSEAEREWDRATICISSQVGCAVDCQFCLTALLGMKRNLTAGEIVGQVCAVLNDQQVSPPRDRVNLVFMGMGEPFLNYDNFMKSVRQRGFSRVELGAGHCISNTVRAAGACISEDFGGSGNTCVHPASAREGYFCGMRAVETNVRDDGVELFRAAIMLDSAHAD